MTAPRVGSAARASVAVAAVAALVLLAGCAGQAAPPKATPTRSAKPTPSATPTAEDDKARVVIDGTSVRVYGEDGKVALDLSYTIDAATAASRLDQSLDETAQASTVTTDQCYQQLDESSWGGLHIFSTTDGLTRPGSAQFYVRADAAETGSGLPIELPSGQTVGATKSQVLAANTEAPSFSNGNTLDLHYDIVQGSADEDAADYYGALAEIVGGKLTLIDSPIYYSRPC